MAVKKKTPSTIGMSKKMLKRKKPINSNYFLDVGPITENQELFFKEWVKNNLKINFENKSSVLKVEYFSKDKELILEVLELISSKYKAYSKRDTEKQLTKTIEYLELQIELMKEK